MKKKLLIVSASLGLGGSEKAMAEMVRHFDLTRYDVTLLALLKTDAEVSFPAMVKVINGFIDINVSSPLTHDFVQLIKHRKWKIMAKRFSFSVNCKLNKEQHTSKAYWEIFGGDIPAYPDRFDIAIGYGQGMATLFTAEKVRAKKKYAWINTDLEKAHYDIQYLQKFYLPMDGIFTDSENGKTNAERIFPEMKSKCHVFRNILDTDDIREKANGACDELKDSDVNIVSVGRLVQAKAFHFAVSAAKILKDAGVQFKWYIIGDGSERAHLEKMISDLNVEDCVYLLGKKNNPYPYIKKCTVYVQTSIYEGSCITLDEARILCKPLVTTNFPAALEKIENGKNGLIVDMNARAIASAVQDLLLDSARRNDMVSVMQKDFPDYSKQMEMLYQVIEE